MVFDERDEKRSLFGDLEEKDRSESGDYNKECHTKEGHPKECRCSECCGGEKKDKSGEMGKYSYQEKNKNKYSDKEGGPDIEDKEGQNEKCFNGRCK